MQQNPEMNEDQIRAAINAGMALLDPQSDMLAVYRQHTGGLLLLRQLLLDIGQGRVQLSTVDPVLNDGRALEPELSD
jgi:hypothetical protein